MQTAQANLMAPLSRSYSLWPTQTTVVQTAKVRAEITIFNTVARTRLDIEIVNTGTRVEMGTLLIPLPDGAVPYDMAYSADGWSCQTQVLRKTQAQQIFNTLVWAVRDPALVEFAGHDLLMTRAFPIEPGARRTITLLYWNILEYEQGRVDYRLPRTQSLQYEVPWEIVVQIRSSHPISTVYSPSHHLIVERISDKQVKVELDGEAGDQPGPFQLSYLRQGDGVSASVYAYPDEDGAGGYFLLLAGLPAELPPDVVPLKRELTLVLDRSGSMSGTKIQQAKAVTQQIISMLEPDEAFNVITYDSSVQFFSSQPVVKNAQTETAAWNYVQAVTATGGTNLHEALRLSLAQTPAEGMLPLVLFLTDGLPTSGIVAEVAIRDLVVSANPHDRRVFTVGVGLDVNAALLQGLAELSRARAEFILPGESVEEKVGRVFASLNGPILSDGQLRVLNLDGDEAVGRTWDVIPMVLPDLYEGDKLTILGRYVGVEPMVFEVSGHFVGQDRTYEFLFEPAAADRQYAFVPRLWASRKIAEMIYEIRQLGADPSMQRDDPRLLELTDTIVAMSIEYGILTEYTAFLAQENVNLNGAGTPGSAAGGGTTGEAAGNIYDRGVACRSGGAGVNQSINLRAQLYQEVLNPDNSYIDVYMRPVRITNVQQVADLAFYYKDGRWIDSRLFSVDDEVSPVRTIEYASAEFLSLMNELALQGRQAALSFGDDVVLQVGGQAVLILMPPEAPKHAPDPAGQTGSGSSSGGSSGGGSSGGGGAIR